MTRTEQRQQERETERIRKEFERRVNSYQIPGRQVCQMLDVNPNAVSSLINKQNWRIVAEFIDGMTCSVQDRDYKQIDIQRDEAMTRTVVSAAILLTKNYGFDAEWASWFIEECVEDLRARKDDETQTIIEEARNAGIEFVTDLKIRKLVRGTKEEWEQV